MKSVGKCRKNWHKNPSCDGRIWWKEFKRKSRNDSPSFDGFITTTLPAHQLGHDADRRPKREAERSLVSKTDVDLAFIGRNWQLNYIDNFAFCLRKSSDVSMRCRFPYFSGAVNFSGSHVASHTGDSGQERVRVTSTGAFCSVYIGAVVGSQTE